MPELPEPINEWYEDEKGNFVCLLWSNDDVYLSSVDDYLDCKDAYIGVDPDGKIQVVHWEYWIKHFRVCEDQDKPYYDEYNYVG